MKEKKDLTGLTIKIKKKHRKALDGIEQEFKIAARLMEQGAAKKQTTSESLWAILRKLYPEIIDYQCSYGNGEINVRYKNGDIKAMREDARKKGWLI